MKRGSVDWSLSDMNRRPVMHDTRSQTIVKRLHSAAGGTRYGCDIWSRGTDYSAVDSLGGLLSRGDCPWRVRAAHTLDTAFQKFVHTELAMLTW